MADQNVSLRLSATASGVRGAFSEVQRALAGVGSAAGRAFDPLTMSVARATGGLGDLRTELRGIPGLLSGIGAGVVVRDIIRLADTYSQVTARLRLATQYTGDFEEVQAALRASAESTRAPLADTVELYSRLAPALASVGKTGEGAVGIITTINQAIALSGASATEAQASLQQFGQGLASGVLRGEELNSVLEQTPALADAIAEGMGVTRGELRRLGEQGALTAEAVTTALERVAARVAEDFAQLPLTTGQAITLLRNQLLLLIGEADQGSGAMNALARSIVFVAEGIKSFGETGEALRPFVNFVVNAIDGVSRLFRIVATGLAGYTLAIKQALSGDLEGALATYRAIGDEVERILAEPLAEQQGQRQAAENSAKARLKVEQDLADAMGRLERLRAVEAGKANADILLDDKQMQAKRVEEARKATAEQLKGTEALRDALRTAWDGAIEGARRAREEAATLFQQAGDARQSGLDKATDRRMRGLSEEDRDAAATQEARGLRDEASSSAARAVIKAYEGDLAGAQRLAEQAAKQAERAERYADMITDDDTAANLFEELGKIREQALQAQGKAKQEEAAGLEEQAAAIDEQIRLAEERITALKAELAKPVTIAADIAEAEKQINILKERLDGLQDKTVTVTVNRVETGGGAPAPEAGFWTGGYVRGQGTGTSDSILARLSDGEYVIRAAAVRRYGVGVLNALNGMRLPKFASGGLVSGALQSAATAASAGAAGTPVVLDFGQLGRYSTSAAPDVAGELVRVFQRAALQRGRRK